MIDQWVHIHRVELNDDVIFIHFADGRQFRGYTERYGGARRLKIAHGHESDLTEYIDSILHDIPVDTYVVEFDPVMSRQPIISPVGGFLEARMLDGSRVFGSLEFFGEDLFYEIESWRRAYAHQPNKEELK